MTDPERPNLRALIEALPRYLPLDPDGPIIERSQELVLHPFVVKLKDVLALLAAEPEVSAPLPTQTPEPPTPSECCCHKHGGFSYYCIQCPRHGHGPEPFAGLPEHHQPSNLPARSRETFEPPTVLNMLREVEVFLRELDGNQSGTIRDLADKCAASLSVATDGTARSIVCMSRETSSAHGHDHCYCSMNTGGQATCCHCGSLRPMRVILTPEPFAGVPGHLQPSNLPRAIGGMVTISVALLHRVINNLDALRRPSGTGSEAPRP